MKWYSDRLDELENAAPVLSVCGDDCAVCPRYLARTEDELRETAVFWYKAGWRDRVLPPEEMRCREFLPQLDEANAGTEILADYASRTTVTLGELMPGWWGYERYARAKEGRS